MILKALRGRLRAAPPASSPQKEERRDTGRAAALSAEGERLAATGAYEDAADSFALAIAHDALCADAWLGYGRVMREAGQLDAAIEHLEKCVALTPRAPAAWLELARAYKQAGKTPEAAIAYERAIDAEPNEPAAYVNLGLLCLAQLGEPKRAEALLRRAIALAPELAEAQTNLGLAMHDQGRWHEALAHFERLADDHPECVEYRWHRACERLSLGDFAGGWDDYEARKERASDSRRAPRFPEWNGGPLDGGVLLLEAEQGIGDEIMFASCIPDAARAAGRCIVECDQRIAGLFSRSFSDVVVQAVDRKTDDRSWLGNYPRIAAQCAVGSLPRLFRRSREAFAGESYLRADPQRAAHWRERLNRDGTKLNVGIAWRGGTYHTRGELRSTELRDWLPLLACDRVRCHALQALTPDERSAVPHERLHELAGLGANFDELAAAVAALDLVITVQGTTAHLAGALGRPVWILLPSSPEWRYLVEGEAMPWYRSARLFRQRSAGDWQPVLRAVAEALAA